VAQIGEAVSQMDQATQQNAALVEESAAAAESLKVQAQQLVQVVDVFKLGNDPAYNVAPSMPQRAAVPAAKPAPIERRSPKRAKNVSRLAPRTDAAAAPASAALDTAPKTGTDDWTTF